MYDLLIFAALAAVAWVVGACGLAWLLEPALQAALAGDDEGDHHA